MIAHSCFCVTSHINCCALVRVACSYSRCITVTVWNTVAGYHSQFPFTVNERPHASRSLSVNSSDGHTESVEGQYCWRYKHCQACTCLCCCTFEGVRFTGHLYYSELFSCCHCGNVSSIGFHWVKPWQPAAVNWFDNTRTSNIELPSGTQHRRNNHGDRSPSTFWTLGPPMGWSPPTFDNKHKLIKCHLKIYTWPNTTKHTNGILLRPKRS